MWLPVNHFSCLGVFKSGELFWDEASYEKTLYVHKTISFQPCGWFPLFLVIVTPSLAQVTLLSWFTHCLSVKCSYHSPSSQWQWVVSFSCDSTCCEANIRRQCKWCAISWIWALTSGAGTACADAVSVSQSRDWSRSTHGAKCPAQPAGDSEASQPQSGCNSLGWSHSSVLQGVLCKPCILLVL